MFECKRNISGDQEFMLRQRGFDYDWGSLRSSQHLFRHASIVENKVSPYFMTIYCDRPPMTTSMRYCDPVNGVAERDSEPLAVGSVFHKYHGENFGWEAGYGGECIQTRFQAENLFFRMRLSDLL